MDSLGGGVLGLTKPGRAVRGEGGFTEQALGAMSASLTPVGECDYTGSVALGADVMPSWVTPRLCARGSGWAVAM